ncbi:MAG: hypothetical protein LUC34_01270, partial [Campylobacter sp.]|nr:hypothetical protein [Campylobacter sp.]
MATIQIPSGASELQIGGKWIKIPQGASEADIDDNILSHLNAPQQNNQARQNLSQIQEEQDYINRQLFSAPQTQPQTQHIKPQSTRDYENETWYETLYNDFKRDTKQALNTLTNAPQKVAEEFKNVWDMSALGSGAAAGESKEKTMRRQTALLQNDSGLISSLFESKDAEQNRLKQRELNMDKLAQKYGYDGAINHDGKDYFIKLKPDGSYESQDVTPGFIDHFNANKGEIESAIGAGVLTGITGGGTIPMILSSAGGAGLDGKIESAKEKHTINNNIDLNHS